MAHKKLSSGKWMTVLTLLVILMSALLYKPIPDGVLEPWKARQAVGLLRFIGAWAYLGELIGLGTFIPNTRIIVDTLSLIPPKYYDGIKVKDSYFGGTKVRLYIPENPDDRKAGILFVHGGGWLICSVETHDHIVSEISRRLNVMVVSVDYRLCPENPYPAPLQDSLNALLYFIDKAEKYGVDPSRIGIVGDSAGGNMAAALALKLRSMSDSVPQPKLQALIYPTLQAVDLKLPSYVQNENAVIGAAEETALVLLSYMGVDMSYASVMAQNNHTDGEVEETFHNLVGKYLPKQKSKTEASSLQPSAASSELTELVKPYLLDPFCFPLMQQNLTGLPKTYIATAEHDPLRDDGILYAGRLKDAGVNVTLINYMDGFHGILAFFQYPIKMDVGMRMMDNLIAFLDENL